MFRPDRLWHWFTEPSEKVRLPEQRRRVRFLLSILAVLWIVWLLIVLSIPVQVMLEDQVSKRRYLLAVFPFILLAVGLFVLIASLFARNGFYTTAARILVVATIVPPMIELFMIHNMLVIIVPITGVVISSALLVPVDTIVCYAVTIIGYLLVPQLLPGVGYSNVANVIMVTTMIGSVSLAQSILRNRDLAQIEQQSVELLKNQDRLLEAKKMEAVARLSSGVAHEFNNILMAISGNAEIIEMTADGATGEYTKRIRKSVERASRLTENLLSFSQQQLLRPVTVDLDQVLKAHQLKLKESLGSGMMIEISTSNDTKNVHIDVELFCTAIQTMVKQSATNVNEQGTIKIQTRVCDLSNDNDLYLSAGTYCAIDISGGSSVEIPASGNRQFEPFFTTGEFGSGDVDLTAAYGIVRQSGGYVEAETNMLLGVTFVVMVPRCAPPNAE